MSLALLCWAWVVVEVWRDFCRRLGAASAMSAPSQGAPGQQPAFLPALAYCPYDGVGRGLANKQLDPAQEILTPEMWLSLPKNGAGTQTKHAI